MTHEPTMRRARTSLDRMLLTSCAIGLALVAVARVPEARAQAFQGVTTDSAGNPIPNTPGTNVAVAGSATRTNTSATSETIVLGTATTVINWLPNDRGPGGLIDFLPTGTTATFQRGSGGFTVLNRILPEVLSRPIGLNGTVNAFQSTDPLTFGGNVWFYSPGGIVVGATGRFNVGGLVLTANDIPFTANVAGGPVGGINFGPNGEIQFRAAANSTAAVEILAGAVIIANSGITGGGDTVNGGSYVVAVAPRVTMGGTALIDGSAAYLAAEQADVTINNGLFDINFLLGTTSGNAVEHTGATGVLATPGAQRRIFIGAMPKNNAITMLVGGTLGTATGATLDNGTVVITGGYDVSGGAIGQVAQGVDVLGQPLPSPGTVDLRIGSTVTNRFLSNVAARVSGNLVVSPERDRLIDFDGNATLTGDISALIETDVNERILVGGDLQVNSSGNATVRSEFEAGYGNTAGQIDVTGALGIDTSRNVAGFSTTASTGGTAALQVNGGLVSAASTTLRADAQGGNDINAGLAGTGGTASVTVETGGIATLGALTVSATGRGGNSPAPIVPGAGAGQGGNANIVLSGGTLNASTVTIEASGFGGANINPTGLSAAGRGGNASLSFGGGTANITGDVAVRANGGGGGGLNAGNGIGGNATVNVLAPAVTLSNLTVSANGFGGANPNGLAPRNGGDGSGGNAAVTVGAAAGLTVNSTLGVEASGSGSSGDPNFTGGSGGDATGGRASLRNNGGTISAANATIAANAEAGFAGVDGLGGNARAVSNEGGPGALAEVTLTAGTTTFGSLGVIASARGGASQGGSDGAADGTNFLARVITAGSGTLLTVNGDLIVESNALAPAGGDSGGALIGGNALVEASTASTITVTGALTASATANGEQAFDSQPSGSANATGGIVNVGASGGTLNLATTTLDAGASALFAATNPGDATGGRVTLFSEDLGADQGLVQIAGANSNFSARANGQGGNGLNGGAGTGGIVTLAADGGDIALPQFASFTADGRAGESRPGGASADGRGGAVLIRVDDAFPGGSITFGNLFASANGSGEFGYGASGDAGDGFGGTVDVDLEGGTLTGDFLSLFAGGFGGAARSGTGPAFQAGDGFGGTVTFDATGGNATISGVALGSLGSGGGAFTNFSGDTVPALAGNGTGGAVTFNALAGALTFDSLSLDATGSGGQGGGTSTGNASAGGTGTGGSASFNLAGIANYSGGGIDISAPGFGGLAGSADLAGTGERGGAGVGGTSRATLTSGGFDVIFIDVDANGFGGRGGSNNDDAGTGGVGGDGRGGAAELVLGGENYTLDQVFIGANGTGGEGGFADRFEPTATGGAGGGGFGGSARLTVSTSQTIDRLELSTAGTGGEGQSGGVGGAGGAGTGGVLAGGTGGAFVNVTGGAVDLGDVLLRSTGEGGLGGVGGEGMGGVGGTGTGGDAGFNASGADTELRFGTRPIFDPDFGSDGSLVAADGIGGAGGFSGDFSFDEGSDGADGGAGAGGRLIMTLSDGATMIGGEEVSFRANGTGGEGSFGEFGYGVDGGSGGRGGDGTGGAIDFTITSGARLLPTDPDENLLDWTFNAFGTGGDGANGAEGFNSAGGDGGDGGTGTGGTAALNLLDGGSAAFSSLTLDAGAAGGDAGRGNDGSERGGAGGAGGDATGGLAAVTIDGGQFFAADLNIFAGAEGGVGGAGGSGSDNGAPGGDGGAGGSGAGGTASFTAIDGDFALADATFRAEGFGGFGGEQGLGTGVPDNPVTETIDESVPAVNGANGFGGDGTGGLVTILNTDTGVLADGAVRSLGRLTISASGQGAPGGNFTNFGFSGGGRAELTDSASATDGSLALTSLDAGIFGSNLTGNEGFYLSSSGGAITIEEFLGIQTDAAARFAFSGNGSLEVGDFVDVSAINSIAVTHDGQSGTDPVESISATTLDFFSSGDINAAPGSILRARDGMALQAFGSVEAASLIAENRIAIGAFGNITLGDALVTGAVSAPFGDGPPGGGLIELLAGQTFGGGGDFASNDIVITGDVSATGHIIAEAGGNVIVRGGASVVSDNRVTFRSGDDIVVEAGALVRAADDPLPEFGYGSSGDVLGSPALLSFDAGVLPVFGNPDLVSSIIVDGAIAAPGRAITLTAEAIQADGNPIDSASLFAQLRNLPASSAVGRDDGGQLDPDCVEGNICLGRLSVTNILDVNFANRIRIAGGDVTTDVISLDAREALDIGVPGQPSSFAAGDRLFLRARDGDVTLNDVTVSGPDFAIVAGGSLLGTGTLTGTGDIGINVSDSIVATAIDAGGRLVTPIIDGPIVPGIEIGGDFLVGSVATGIGGLSVDAGGTIDIGTLNASETLLSAGGDVAVGTATVGGAFAAQADGAITLGTVDATFISLLAGTTVTGADLSGRFGIDIDAGGLVDIDAAQAPGDEFGYGQGAPANILIDTAGAIDLGAIEARNNVVLNAGAGVTVGTAQAGNDFAVVAGGDVTVDAVSTLGIDEFGYGGTANVDVSSDGAVGFGSVSSAENIFVNAAGAVTGESFSSVGDTAINGASLSLGTLSAGFFDAESGQGTLSSITLSSGSGDIAFDSATATANVRLDSAGAAAFTGIDAGSDVDIVTAGAVTGGIIEAGDYTTIDSGGDVTVTEIIAGNDIEIDAAGAVALVTARTTGAGGLGSEDSANIEIVAGAGIDIESASSIEGIFLDAGDAIDAATLNARRDIVIGGDGAMALGALRAGIPPSTEGGAGVLADITIASRGAGDIAVTSATASRDISVTGANGASDLLAVTLTAGNGISATLGGTIEIGTARATGAAGTGAGGLARGTIALNANGGVQADQLDAFDDVSLRANNGRVLVITDLRAGGDVTAFGDDVELNAIGALTIADAGADNGNLVAQAGGTLTVLDGDARGDVRLTSTGQDVIVGGVRSGVAPATTIVPGASAIIPPAGPRGPGDVIVTAQRDAILNGAVVADRNLNVTAGNNAAFNAVANGDNITIRSGDIAIGASGQVGTADTVLLDIGNNSTTRRTFIGGAGTTEGYSLSGDEMGRLAATNITLRAPQIGQGGTQPDVTVGAFILAARSGASGAGIGAAGTLRIETPGTVRVNGAVALTNMGTGNRFEIDAARAIEVDTTAGSIALTGQGGALGGTLALTSNEVIAASPGAIGDVRAAATTDAIEDRLAIVDGTTSDDGAFRANGIVVNVTNGFFVQNSGAGQRFAERRGFTVGSGGIDIRSTNASVRIVINGRQVDPAASGAFVTGVDFARGVLVNGSATTRTGFDPRSTVNGCILANIDACIATDFEIVPPPLPNELFDEPLDPEGDGDVPTGSDLPTTIIQLKDFESFGFEPLIDEPVTGAGNDDLYVQDCEPGSTETGCEEEPPTQ